jgi:exodeoxyribonuclease-3
MKFISWNVNGLRAAVRKGFAGVFSALDADFFCVQETKLQAGQIDLDLPGYTQTWSYAEKKGYSGTAIFSRRRPLQVLRELGEKDLDAEGRITAGDFGDFWLVCSYTPNAQPELARLDFRLRWEDAYRSFIMELDREKPVILCGDFNVAHEEIDLARPKPNIGNPGFSCEERAKMTELLAAGLSDCFRTRHPEVLGAYTWWSYRANARANNVGWRIDYFLCSRRLVPQISATPLYPEIEGSDHCPLGLELTLSTRA